MKNEILPCNLYKHLPKEYAEKFLNEGEVLFRYLPYFIFSEDPLRRDPMEHKLETKVPPSAQVKINGRPIEIIQNSLSIEDKLSDAGAYKIACFSKNIKLEKFKNSVIHIFNVEKFIEKLNSEFVNALPSSKLEYGDILYQDRIPVDQEINSKYILLNKRNSYREEDEFRFYFTTMEKQGAFTCVLNRGHKIQCVMAMLHLNIGPLHDIAKII